MGTKIFFSLIISLLLGGGAIIGKTNTDLSPYSIDQTQHFSKNQNSCRIFATCEDHTSSDFVLNDIYLFYNVSSSFHTYPDQISITNHARQNDLNHSLLQMTDLPPPV